MSADIIIRKISETYVYVDAEAFMLRELDDFFVFFVPGYRWMPKFKNKMWDGKIHLFRAFDGRIYAGLIPHIKKFADSRGYSCEDKSGIFPKNQSLPESAVISYTDQLNLKGDEGQPITPYPEQIKAILYLISNKRGIVVSPTASGKSLVIYTMIRMLQKILKQDEKILLIVPRVALVHQMANDFASYSKADDSWDAETNIHIIPSKTKDAGNKRVIISTWQSLMRMPASYYRQQHIGCVITDEVHEAVAKQLCKILERLDECSWRFGLTGTLRDSKTHKLVLEGLLGPARQVVSTKEMMDKGKIAKLKIEFLRLKYSIEEAKLVNGLKYKDEIEWLLFSNQKRNNFIAKLLTKISASGKNTLVLFDRIKHGEDMIAALKEIKTFKGKAYRIHGGTKVEEREQVRTIVEEQEGTVIFASSQIFSTGSNIKNIEAIVFASPTKSKIRTLQSIGRGLRLRKGKTSVTLYDIIDDLSYKGPRGGYVQNFAVKHFTERLDIYSKEQFDYRMTDIDMSPLFATYA